MSLQPLIDALLSETPETPTWQSALERLVDRLLTERLIARPRKGKVLSGIYKEIYDGLRQELLTQVQAIARTENRRRKLTVPWLRATLPQTSQAVITYDVLTRLALALQQQVHKSPDWQYASSELFGAVLRSGKLRRPNWMARQSAALYGDVLNDAMEYAVNNIARFNPEKSHFAGWVNKICLEMYGRNTAAKEKDTLVQGYLSRIKGTKARLSSAIRTKELNATQDYFQYYLKTNSNSNSNSNSSSDYLMISLVLLWLRGLMVTEHKTAMDLLYEISKESIDRPVELQSMDAVIQHEDGSSQAAEIQVPSAMSASPPMSEFLIKCLMSCSTESCNAVLEEHVRDHPEATFRAIAIQRAQEEKWRDISERFNIPVPTLSAHYGRRIDKAVPGLKDCVEDQFEIWKMQNRS